MLDKVKAYKMVKFFAHPVKTRMENAAPKCMLSYLSV